MVGVGIHPILGQEDSRSQLPQYPGQSVPRFEIGHVETPSPFTEYGVKGGGEGGRMIAPAAIASAVEDALAPLGVRVHEVPLTPERIVKLVEASRR